MGGIKLAIADDQVLFRKGLASITGDFDIVDSIVEANNGRELIELLQTFKPEVILMDLKMPEMDGIEATKIIRNEYPEIKIIVLSMYDDDKFILHLLELGANGYLLKNADPEEVEEAIEAVVKGGYYFNDYVTKVMHNGLFSKKEKIKPSLNSKVNLTPREMEVLELICKEYTNAEIAEQLFLSARTIEGYRNKLLDKLGSRNTAGLVAFAIKNKLVTLD